MNRKKFITATGFYRLSVAFGSSLFGQKKKQILQKEKIILKSEGKQLNVLGDHQLIKLTGKDTDGQFAKIYLDNPPYTQVPLHIHGNEDEVFNVIEGEVEFSVGGKTTLLKNGDAIFLPRNKPHKWKVVGTTNAKIHVDVFSAGLENMFEELSKLTTESSDLPKVAAICDRYKVRFV